MKLKHTIKLLIKPNLFGIACYKYKYTYALECKLYTGSDIKKLLIIVNNINNSTGNI